MYKITLFLSLLSMVSLKGAYTFEEFKKEYFEEYVFSEEEKHSLSSYAPIQLRQWFENIEEGAHPSPVLLYGAYGVGKTTVSQTLAQNTGHAVCYLGMLAVMRADWQDKPFILPFLAAIQEKTCVIVDSVERFSEDDVENLEALVDLCNTQENLHLLVIAYHAQLNMPAKLYNSFHSIKFPVPAPQERLQLLQFFIKNRRIPNIDQKTLTDFNKKLVNFTPRGIGQLVGEVGRNFRMHDNQFPENIVLQDHFNKALKKCEKMARYLGLVFDECE